jgi:hypothetical protein
MLAGALGGLFLTYKLAKYCDKASFNPVVQTSKPIIGLRLSHIITPAPSPQAPVSPRLRSRASPSYLLCFRLCQVPREFPYDNLKEDLGGDNGVESCAKHH